MLELNKIYNGDCIEVMKEIDDESIDLILTDPPYNISEGRRNFRRKGRADLLNDFGSWDKYSNEEYLKFLADILTEFYRVLKISGSVYVFIGFKYVSYLKEMWEALGGNDRHTFVWCKTNPPPHFMKTCYINSTEIASYMVKEKGRQVFNFGLQKEMHNFLETSICSGKERTKHPTQKPEKLLQHLIKISSNENDLVLDPFSGSGSTCISALKLNRNYIGIEKDEEYFKLSSERLNNIENQQKLF